MFHTKRHTFLVLCDRLRQKNLLKDARHILVEERLAIFMKTVGLRETNRDIVDRFQHNPETISSHLSNVLKALCTFSKEVVTRPDFKIFTNTFDTMTNVTHRLRSVGAIDTHVSAWVRADKQIPYLGERMKRCKTLWRLVISICASHLS